MTHPVLEGLEAFEREGGPTGILILHGFTANPSGLRPLGEWLAARGYSVSCPLLPGHGSHWEDLETVTWQDWESEASAALDELLARCASVAVMGISFGASLALHLAATRPADVGGLVLVNPYVADRRIFWAPIVRHVRRTVAGVADDIAKPGSTERGYTRVPVRALVQVARFHRLAARELRQVRQPLLVFESARDNVIPKGNAGLVMRGVASKDAELVPLPRSHHVAWLDHDAALIFERTHGFVSSRLPAPG